MSDRDKSLGERVGAAVDKVKDVAQDAFASADEKRKEAGARGSANVHDAQAETSDNPIDGAKHRVAGAVDRLKAEGHDGKAEFHEARAKDRTKRD
jgi:hypothetical protein